MNPIFPWEDVSEFEGFYFKTCRLGKLVYLLLIFIKCYQLSFERISMVKITVWLPLQLFKKNCRLVTSKRNAPVVWFVGDFFI